MELIVAPTPEGAAARAARHIAAALTQAISERGVGTLALSGGGSAQSLLAALARQPLDWNAVHVFQVDERVAPRGDPGRNLTAIEDFLCDLGPLPGGGLHAMPVEGPDLDGAAARYAGELESLAGRPPALDVAHLGLGADGHTASLFPGDAATGITDRSVAATGACAGYRRLTLTLPVLNAARCIVWFVVGAAKAPALARLIAGEAGPDALPAVRVARERAFVFADGPAATMVDNHPR